jgi:hypothetical protein
LIGGPGGSARRFAATASIWRRSAISSSSRRSRASRYSGVSFANVMAIGVSFGG